MTEQDDKNRTQRIIPPELVEQKQGKHFHTVYAELSYNPYLRQTTVHFNGQTPKINSLVETYQDRPLRDWVDRLPSIFYDEMNGYDFDLYFSGTKSDLFMVQRAFAKAGASPQEVRLRFHNQLEDVDVKYQEVRELLQWLKDHPNRKFDPDAFLVRSRVLWEESYPYIIINGTLSEWPDPQIAVESVDHATELNGMDLSNSPILICVDSREQLQADLLPLLPRKDVEPRQLFFLLRPDLNAEQIQRVILDLGVEQPQIIASADDPQVRTYFYHYPITQYIQTAIQHFKAAISEISAVLNVETEESKRLNAAIHEEISRLEDTVSRLKQTDDLFVRREDFYTPQEFWAALSELESKIKSWGGRKTKAVGEQEIAAAAQEYEAALQSYAARFETRIQADQQAIRTNLCEGFQAQFSAQGVDADFLPDISLAPLPAFEIPPIQEELLALQEVRFEEPKSDFINLLRRPSGKEERLPVRVVRCSYEQWRKRAAELILSIAAQYVGEAADALRVYYDGLAEAFHIHLTELISAQTQEKDHVLAQLSDEERNLQKDSDWLRSFQEQLLWIERG